MSADRGCRESAALNRIKDDFERRGFNFIIEPGPNSLPDFLRSFRPDAIAEKGDKHVIIEVSAGPSMETANTLSRINDVVREQPNWELKVIWLDEVAGGEPTLVDLQAQFGDAKTLLENGQLRAALLLSCSILEGASRLLLRERGEPIFEENLISILKTLVSLGELEENRFYTLKKIVLQRNDIAHGNFSVEVKDEWIKSVLEAAADLIAKLRSEAGTPTKGTPAF